MSPSIVGQPLRSIHVGVGTRGKSHIRAALECGYWRPVALVDVVPAYLAAAREMTGLPESVCFTRVEDALAAVEADAVIIASPVMFHAQQIIAGLQGGRAKGVDAHEPAVDTVLDDVLRHPRRCREWSHP